MVPDISLNSGGVGQDYYFGGALGATGGTSIAAPEIAGFFARENSFLDAIGPICGADHASSCGTMGQAHWALYGEGLNGYSEHNPYYDTTSGCNSNDATAYYGLT